MSPEVRTALKKNKPVVALESTIISHGMPYPQNVETALLVEETVREYKAIPATVAIFAGKICVGISKKQVKLLGKKGPAVHKASRRDLPVLLAKKEDGATTVATTLIAAGMAGLTIFATGGIGGVHRGGSMTMDISADLEELARTDVSVVCAGAKSILDLGLTLEYLETKGVPVIGYKTSHLPAFYCQTSGFSVDYQLNTPEEIADAIKVKRSCGLSGGILIVNPIPKQYAMPEETIQRCIESALIAADKQNVTGKAVTPFLLNHINTLTNGESLEANIQLVLNNARLGAEIAVAMCR